MGTVDAGTIAGEGRVRYRTTVHGPVTGYAKAGGKRVAIARKRASFGRDVLWQLPFRDATIGRISGTRSFAKSFARSPFTFNVGYADDRDIAMFSAGQLPRRDPRVDPRLPTLGTGGYEWRGTLASSKLPQQVNPAGGALLNWNNSPAPGFGAADDNWSYGSLHRVSLLQNQIARRAKHDLASVTSAMNAAATQDLRSTALTPTLSTLLRGGPAQRARPAHARAAGGVARGGSCRLDRDEDGAMDSGGAPAIMDAFYPHLYDAVLGGALGPQLADLKALEGAKNGAQLHRRRDQLDRQGPAAAARHAVQAPVQHPLLRRRRPRRVPHRGLERARRRGPGARDRAGQREPGRLEVRRRGRAHQVRARAADDDDPLHEPPERHPAGHLVQGAPQPPALGTPPDASRSRPE